MGVVGWFLVVGVYTFVRCMCLVRVVDNKQTKKRERTKGEMKIAFTHPPEAHVLGDGQAQRHVVLQAAIPVSTMPMCVEVNDRSVGRSVGSFR